MKKVLKIIIPILIVLLGVGIVFIDESNTTVEDVIYQEAATGDTSPVKSMLGVEKSGNISIYIYETEDGRLGFATIEESNSLLGNKYSLCTVENITEQLLKSNQICREYDKQGMDFYCGVIANPSADSITYKGKNIKLKILDYDGYKIGIYILNNLA